jgi:hypothetical protein
MWIRYIIYPGQRIGQQTLIYWHYPIVKAYYYHATVNTESSYSMYTYFISNMPGPFYCGWAGTMVPVVPTLKRAYMRVNYAGQSRGTGGRDRGQFHAWNGEFLCWRRLHLTARCVQAQQYARELSYRAMNHVVNVHHGYGLDKQYILNLIEFEFNLFYVSQLTNAC